MASLSDALLNDWVAGLSCVAKLELLIFFSTSAFPKQYGDNDTDLVILIANCYQRQS